MQCLTLGDLSDVNPAGFEKMESVTFYGAAWSIPGQRSFRVRCDFIHKAFKSGSFRELNFVLAKDNFEWNIFDNDLKKPEGGETYKKFWTQFFQKEKETYPNFKIPTINF